MNVGLKGALSSVVALGCITSAIPGALSFAEGENNTGSEKKVEKASADSEKSGGEEKKKKEEEEDKKNKLETAANALSIASSASSLLAPGAVPSNSDAVLRELDLTQRLKTIKLLDESIKSLDKKQKSSIEKVSEEVGRTLEYIGDHPVKSLVGTFGAVAGVKVFQTVRDSGYISDEVIAAFSPDLIKNANEARASKIKLETSIIDREGKLLDLDARMREREFYVNRPELSNAKNYAKAAGDALQDISKGVASFFGAFFSGGKK